MRPRPAREILLVKFGAVDEVAELCIGHGIKGVYNRYKYFEARRAALLLLLEALRTSCWRTAQVSLLNDV